MTYTYFADETGRYMLHYTTDRVIMLVIHGGELRRLREYTYKNGVINGPMVVYHEDGVTRKEEHTYRNGFAHGKSHIYNADGSIYADCVFKDGELNGQFRIWYDVDKGLLAEKALCKNDMPVYKYRYDGEGRIDHEYYYDEGGRCVEEVNYMRKNGHCYVARKSGDGKYVEDIYF